MGFNSAFKGLIGARTQVIHFVYFMYVYLWPIYWAIIQIYL